MSRSAVIPRSGWMPEARQLGFTFTDGEAVLHRLGMSLAVEGRWAAFRIEGSEDDAGPRTGPLSGPGLWKRDRDGSLRFDLPPIESEQGPVDRLSALLDWAVDSSAGRLLEDWAAPPEHEVGEWASGNGFTVRAAPLRVRGSAGWSPRQLVPSFPRVAEVPEATPPARRAWAEEILAEAQSRWRMVRFGTDPETGRIRAEVNLTGAPGELLEPLFRVSLVTLAGAVRWVLRPLNIALDPRVESRLLESPPLRRSAAERNSDA